MLNFDEFRAVSNRDKAREASVGKSATSVSKRRTKAVVDDLAPDNAPPAPTPRSNTSIKSIFTAIGEFLETHQMQAIYVFLVLLDTFSAFAEVFFSCRTATASSQLILRAVRSICTFSLLFFLVEIVFVALVFRTRVLGHLGYVLDALILSYQVYADYSGLNKINRLLNFVRMWRLFRFLNSMVLIEKDAHNETKEKLEAVEAQVKSLSIDNFNARTECEKEKEARNAIENMLQSYKDEVDTLNEALKIAAMDIAEVAQGDEAYDFEEGEMEDFNEEDASASLGESAFLSQGSGSVRKNKASVMGRVLASEGTSSAATTAFLVHEDGTFEHKNPFAVQINRFSATTRKGSLPRPAVQMHLSVQIAVAIALFIAFSIGLNIGLHGLISWHPSDPVQIHQARNDAKDAMVATAMPGVVEDKPTSSLVSMKPVATHTNPPAVVSALERKLATIGEVVNRKILDSGATDVSDSEKEPMPIVLLTCNRPQLLEKTLESLLSVRGIVKNQILVAQDGSMPEVANIVRKNGLNLVQNTAGLRGTDGGSRIAMHYKFSLSTAFSRSPKAQAIIIIEDDLLFSPDFYEYFNAVSPIMEKDPSVFVVSAWNDNGFKSKIHDPLALKRTDYFPGLGWMLSRRLYKGELEQLWPREHWDHWLRSSAVSKNREIVHPEVPRTYHNGIKGTFMNLETHNKYFRDIGYNTDQSVAWSSDRQHASPLYMQADAAVYETKMVELIKQCKHVERIGDLLEAKEEVVCIWIDVNPVSEWRTPEFEPISTFFGVWHEHRRGSHKGLHDFYWEGNYVLLLNCYDSRSTATYVQHKPSAVKFMAPGAFDKSLLTDMKRRRTPIDVKKAGGPGTSCDQVCAEEGKTCHQEHLELLNSCDVVQEHFKCNGCKKSMGAEQPAYVVPDAAMEFGPGECLVNSLAQHSSCSASHHATIRLCACH